MQTHTFTYGEIFTHAWAKVKEHAWYIFRVFILIAIIMGVAQKLFLVTPLIDLFVGIAIVAISLVIASGKKPTFEDLFESFKTYKITFHYFVASLLVLLSVILGTILLILPGIYLAVRLQFYKFLIVENETMSPTHALKESMRITKGKFWKLFGFVILIILLNLLGLLCLGIGLLITIPVSILAHAFLYKKLTSK